MQITKNAKHEKIIFDGYTYRRYPRSKRRSDKVYFQRIDSDGKPKRLHIAIYEHYKGPVPEGYHIHHKDGNPLNNDISNLEAVVGSAHLSAHSVVFHQSNKEQVKRHLEGIRVKASEWHRSEEGKKWHRQNPPKLVYATYICEQCGSEYTAPKKRTNRFCSNKCKARALRARIRLNGRGAA